MKRLLAANDLGAFLPAKVDRCLSFLVVKPFKGKLSTGETSTSDLSELLDFLLRPLLSAGGLSAGGSGSAASAKAPAKSSLSCSSSSGAGPLAFFDLLGGFAAAGRFRGGSFLAAPFFGSHFGFGALFALPLGFGGCLLVLPLHNRNPVNLGRIPSI